MSPNSESPSRIFIVEDHAFMRESLVSFIERIATMNVCGTAGTAEEALQMIRSSSPDLALVDMSLPGMSGLELIEILRRKAPKVVCAILTAHLGKSYIQDAWNVGAQGYIVKGSIRDLRAAIPCLLEGGRYVSPDLE